MGHKLYSHELPHCLPVGSLHVEAQKDFWNAPRISLSFSFIGRQKLNFDPGLVDELIETLKEAKRHVPPHDGIISSPGPIQSHPFPEGKRFRSARRRERLIGFAVRIAYALYPDVLFYKEIRSLSTYGPILLRLEQNHEGRIYLSLSQEQADFLFRIRVSPSVIPALIKCLLDAKLAFECSAG